MMRNLTALHCLVQSGYGRSDVAPNQLVTPDLPAATQTNYDSRGLYHGIVTVTLSRAVTRLALGRTNPHTHFGAAR
ncbi:hypothetical protein T440DRAFT_203586 [Plenodomus tracheiphilus IPT5]|uniref:Uncharacterized protein n=1 Tax=Plenodomus tracheiphilus IPT5 TaxID=1408161 RepID=A0A6A7BKU3_9PLEO|nr:hypothetical protein T440DRAFT_203586 [Plenodomus tracheiphilus IPT5]